MKTKHLKKKLTLNKVTIGHLNNDELKGINGGAVSLEICTEHTYCEENCDIGTPTFPGAPGCEMDSEWSHALIKNP